MYIDADKKLKELSRTQNQYSDKQEESPMQVGHFDAKFDDTLMTDEELMAAEMLISDEEVMLVGDDFVVSETSFNKQRNEEINNAFVKIENDPRDNGRVFYNMKFKDGLILEYGLDDRGEFHGEYKYDINKKKIIYKNEAVFPY